MGMNDGVPVEVMLSRVLRQRIEEADAKARAAGVSFLPVGSADGITVGDTVTVGMAHSRYVVKRIDPRLSDLFDAESPLIYIAGLWGLDGPFKNCSRRIRSTWLRRA